MYKWLIVTIISIFLIAIVIRQCTTTETSLEYFDTITAEFDVKGTTGVETEPDDIVSFPTKKLDLNKIEEFPSRADIQSVSLEIPRIIDPVPSQILQREGYTLSYNRATKCANWVAWKLTKEHTDGVWSRKGIKYMEDIEAEYPRQEVGDWKINPERYDHGHMCPAGDNKWSKLAMEQSFLLTNMCPQHKSLNSGDWKDLEEKCRDWANEYGEIYIVCGPVFYDGKKGTIGGSKEIWIPDAFFKVILTGVEKNKPKAIGFIYKNTAGNRPLDSYVNSIDQVERITGFDFFSELPDEIENRVEKECNLKEWK